jgi:RNA polymerase sigma-70 factor (ECF subfamily)
VDDLPDSYREIITLRDMEELSVNDTAQLLGISTALVKVRLHRARLLLQKKLAPQLKRASKPAEKRAGGRSWFGRLSWL